MLKDFVSIMKLSIVYYSRVEVTFNHVLTQLSSENNNNKKIWNVVYGNNIKQGVSFNLRFKFKQSISFELDLKEKVGALGEELLWDNQLNCLHMLKQSKH